MVFAVVFLLLYFSLPVHMCQMILIIQTLLIFSLYTASYSSSDSASVSEVFSVFKDIEAMYGGIHL